MANNCYNTFSFFGNAKVKKQVESWNSEMKALVSEKATSQLESVIFEVFFPNAFVNNPVAFIGTKWAYPDFGASIPLASDELGFVSAWEAMDGFQDHITGILSRLDKNVVVLLMSNTDSLDEAARYSAMGLDGEITSQVAYLQFAEGDDTKEDPQNTLFYEHMRDSCDDLIEAVPGIKIRLKAHLKFLDDAFDKSLKK